MPSALCSEEPSVLPLCVEISYYRTKVERKALSATEFECLQSRQMGVKMKILILYFSGTGSTKWIAELMQSCLLHSEICTADLFSVENSTNLNLIDYDAFIIGTPVYHGAPSNMIKKYFDLLSPLSKRTPAFIFNTRAWCSCNTNRLLAKQLLKKNIITVKDRDYQTPASDGALILPVYKKFFTFEKNIHAKIHRDCMDFLEQLRAEQLYGYIPRFRFSSIINSPNKLMGQMITFKIFLHQDKCVKCGRCIQNCPHHALKRSKSGYPLFLIAKCENCYRCIHHCPAKALSLSKRTTPKKVLSFYK